MRTPANWLQLRLIPTKKGIAFGFRETATENSDGTLPPRRGKPGKRWGLSISATARSRIDSGGDSYMSGAFGIPGPSATDYELEKFASACRDAVAKSAVRGESLIPWGSVSFTPAQLLKIADRADIRRGAKPPSRKD